MQKENNVVNEIKCFPGRLLSGVSRLYGRLVNKETTLLYQQRISGRSGIKCGMTNIFNNGGFTLYTAPISRIRPYGKYRDDEARCGGFTLIELLVVVLIIGILAAVAVPQYQKAVMKTRYVTMKVFVNAWAAAEERYYLANGSYTVDIENLDIDFPETPKQIDYYADARGYHFDWGYCGINDDDEPRLGCKNPSINLDYGEQLPHVPANASASVKQKAGRRRCMVVDNNHIKASLAHKICQQETGKTVADEAEGRKYLY